MRSLTHSRPSFTLDGVRSFLRSAGLLTRWPGSARKEGSLGQEFRRAVDLSFRLAQSCGRPVTLAPTPAPGRISLRLPRGIAWGKPEGVPLPPGTLDPRWALTQKPFLVSPWRTATEGMWFLKYRGLPYCLRLTARGGVQVLCFERRLGWQEA